MRRTLRLLAACVIIGPALVRAGDLARLPVPIPLNAEARAAAMTAGVPLGPVTLSSAAGEMRVGDGVVVLITLTNGSTQKQWVVQFEADRLREEEKDPKNDFRATVTTGSGRKLIFSSHPTLALKIRALGPFTTRPQDTKPGTKVVTVVTEKNMRVPARPELLSIGLDRACRAMLDHGFTSLTSNANDLGKLPEVDENAVMCSVVALSQFFMIAEQTPGLKEIVYEILDLPSMWSLARGLGKISPGIDFGSVPIAALDPSGWSEPSLPLYRYPFNFTLNDKPAVNCNFFVAKPTPPLLTTAGILGFTAESPSHKDKHMLAQIVSAYRGKLEIEKPDPATISEATR